MTRDGRWVESVERAGPGWLLMSSWWESGLRSYRSLSLSSHSLHLSKVGVSLQILQHGTAAGKCVLQPGPILITIAALSLSLTKSQKSRQSKAVTKRPSPFSAPEMFRQEGKILKFVQIVFILIALLPQNNIT